MPASVVRSWLRRSLTFIQKTLEEYVNSLEKSPSACLREGYQVSLHAHHNMVTKQMMRMIFQADHVGREQMDLKLATSPDDIRAPLVKMMVPPPRAHLELHARARRFAWTLPRPPTAIAQEVLARALESNTELLVAKLGHA